MCNQLNSLPVAVVCAALCCAAHAACTINQLQVLGGGRIEHYPEQQVVSVYGYSAAFGPAVHEVAAGLIQKAYPFYNGITWSYEGY